MDNKIKKKDNQLIVTNIKRLSEDFSQLQLNEKFSDVTIIVDETKFCAHKNILSARSAYFEALICGQMLESSKSEITIKDATSTAFEKLLKYLYTGTVTVDDSETDLVLDVLELAHKFCIKDLELSLVETLKLMLNIENSCSVLNAAILFDLKDLIECCHSYLDNNAIEILSSNSFVELTPVSIVELLKRNSFFAPEIEIFNAVAKWCVVNGANENIVLKCVRLSCLTVFQIVTVVWPSRLVDNEILLNAIAENIDAKPRKIPCRSKLLWDENVATPAKNATVIHGNKTEYLLTGNRDVNRWAECAIGDENGITIKLSELYTINHISLSLYDSDRRCYSYYIEVSTDQKTWKKVTDYEDYACRSYQNLYFDMKAVQYIRIIGTRNTENQIFHLIFFEAYCKNSIPEVRVSGIIRPISNVATLDKKALVIEGVSPDNLLNEMTTGYTGTSGFTYHTINSGSYIIIQLAQPYLISTMKLLLWDLDNRYYHYYIETSVNKTDWEMVVDRKNERCKSWQTLSFSEKPVVFIKIVGTFNSDVGNNAFHCVHFECPATDS